MVAELCHIMREVAFTLIIKTDRPKETVKTRVKLLLKDLHTLSISD